MEKDLAPLMLAYLGDAVLEVMIRRRLIAALSGTAACNKAALSFVTAPKQAEAAKRIRDELAPEEKDVFSRGRNAKPHSIPHGARPYEYRLATGLEALFGWLFLEDQTERMEELLEKAFPELSELKKKK